MIKKVVLLNLLLFSLYNVQFLYASSKDEINYALALEKRQNYCRGKSDIFFYSSKFIQPLMDLDQKNIKDISNLYCMATFYEDNGKLDEAMVNYLAILKLEPNFIDIVIKVAELYETYKGDYNKALTYYGIALNKLDSYLNRDVSFLKEYTNVYSKTIEIYRKIGVSDDFILKMYNDIINKLDDMLNNPIYVNERKEISDKKVAYLLEKADYLTLHNNYLNGYTNEAINIYEEILYKEDPQNSEAIRKLADIYYDLGLLNEAKNLLLYAEENINGFKQDNLLLGKIYFELGEDDFQNSYYRDALSVLNKALMEGSYEGEELAEIYYYRGRTYFVLGACNEAKNDFLQAKTIDKSIFNDVAKGMDWSNIMCN
jgi:tetratricopeptide (TPR) repeat protein